jgi:MoaA/NifB/PqqE/SkfB family radical SAM enzyme
MEKPAMLDSAAIKTFGDGEHAVLQLPGKTLRFSGRWVAGSPWERFGLYDHYVVIRDDGEVTSFPAHAGDLVPGSTEDVAAALLAFDSEARRPRAPLSLELDPTNRCASKDCGGHCFSAAYRALQPKGEIPGDVMALIIRRFAAEGGRIVRFDGGGDPLSHPAVRTGELPELAFRCGLKSTILTSGDALERTNLTRIGAASCYLRVSLNAATDETRRRFHGNRLELSRIFRRIETFAEWIAVNRPGLPIGSTYLLSDANWTEVYDCARRARDAGISHFSVRRVLGPSHLRPCFAEADLDRLRDLLRATRELSTDAFRAFIPWRPVAEEDLNPRRGDFSAAQCWQSTFKTIVESCPEDAYRVQLCGRYRGNGIGQGMQMKPLFTSSAGDDIVEEWRRSFTAYPISRQNLLHTCTSCIDRGFIQMMDALIGFVDPPRRGFEILHLQSPALNGGPPAP